MLSLLIGFSFARAEEAYAILKRTSGYDPSSEITATVRVILARFCPFTLLSIWIKIHVLPIVILTD